MILIFKSGILDLVYPLHRNRICWAPLVELASDLNQAISTRGPNSLGFCPALFYLKTEKDPASETL
jgi:hypothetical protein